MLRSIFSVVVGYAVMAMLVVGIDFSVAKMFPEAFPQQNAAVFTLSTGWWIITIGYSLLCATIGGYITAYVAQRAELKHALALAAVCVVMNIVYIFTTPQQEGVFSYQITILSICLIGVFAGAKIRTFQTSERNSPK